MLRIRHECRLGTNDLLTYWYAQPPDGHGNLRSLLTAIDARQREGWRHTGLAFGLLPDLLSPSGLVSYLLLATTTIVGFFGGGRLCGLILP